MLTPSAGVEGSSQMSPPKSRPASVYHVGNLARDRRRDRPLDELAERLLGRAERGDIELAQRLIGRTKTGGIFEYRWWPSPMAAPQAQRESA